MSLAEEEKEYEEHLGQEKAYLCLWGKIAEIGQGKGKDEEHQETDGLELHGNPNKCTIPEKETVCNPNTKAINCGSSGNHPNLHTSPKSLLFYVDKDQ